MVYAMVYTRGVSRARCYQNAVLVAPWPRWFSLFLQHKRGRVMVYVMRAVFRVMVYTREMLLCKNKIKNRLDKKQTAA